MLLCGCSDAEDGGLGIGLVLGRGPAGAFRTVRTAARGWITGRRVDPPIGELRCPVRRWRKSKSHDCAMWFLLFPAMHWAVFYSGGGERGESMQM